ncbi:PREDICTED: uncharacterized protein LOC106556713 [Thamnophis sirtalis]|uniref:Uncharacterized protein LOC106556713 n=1 Tax=Thamnophis sirtalis TaxID=35019 RepID=A0A6I9Z5N0_9SAUR|nr:PREDICTED: uncharacterized protein LOC106556713 [Thamnophis sirtalis]
MNADICYINILIAVITIIVVILIIIVTTIILTIMDTATGIDTQYFLQALQDPGATISLNRPKRNILAFPLLQDLSTLLLLPGVPIIFLLVNIHHHLLGLPLPHLFLVGQMTTTSGHMRGFLKLPFPAPNVITGVMTLCVKEKKADPQKSKIRSAATILSIVAAGTLSTAFQFQVNTMSSKLLVPTFLTIPCLTKGDIMENT